jgi:ketopantoate reductase
MRVLVIGNGHVGSWLSCTLARRGASVVLKRSPRPLPLAHAAVYRDARVETTPVLQREHVAGLDLLFVTTKTYGHALVAKELAAAPAAVEPRIATVLCHNG